MTGPKRQCALSKWGCGRGGADPRGICSCRCEPWPRRSLRASCTARRKLSGRGTGGRKLAAEGFHRKGRVTIRKAVLTRAYSASAPAAPVASACSEVSAPELYVYIHQDLDTHMHMCLCLCACVRACVAQHGRRGRTKHDLALPPYSNQSSSPKFTASATLNPTLNPQWYLPAVTAALSLSPYRNGSIPHGTVSRTARYPARHSRRTRWAM